jgi:hypothetical protein
MENLNYTITTDNLQTTQYDSRYTYMILQGDFLHLYQSEDDMKQA